MRRAIFYGWVVVAAGWIAVIAGFAALAIRRDRPAAPASPVTAGAGV